MRQIVAKTVLHRDVGGDCAAMHTRCSQSRVDRGAAANHCCVAMMKAAVMSGYGAPSVLALRDVSAPAPKDDEILVRVRASTVSSGDARVRAANFPGGFEVIARLVFGWTKPRQPVLGVDVAGVVEAVGKTVVDFRPGDEVFGMSGMGMGAHAELCVISSKGCIARKPAGLSFEQSAALTFGGTTVLDFFRRARLARGERVLVNGASGAVGVAAIQLAKHLGAHVTAVCSARNFELVESLGADQVIDYNARDFADGREQWDVVMDTVGNAPYRRSKRALRDRGRLLLVLATLRDIVTAPWFSWTSKHRVIAGPVEERREYVETLAELAREGRIRAVIDQEFALERIAEAHAVVDSGRKRGSVVLRVS